MATRQSMILELGGTTTAAGACTLRTNRLRAGQVLCVQAVCVRSDDTDAVKVELGIERDGRLMRLTTLTLTTQEYTYQFAYEVFLASDWQLRLDVSSGGATVPVYAWVYGYLQNTD